jgi:hypothetical protein
MGLFKKWFDKNIVSEIDIEKIVKGEVTIPASVLVEHKEKVMEAVGNINWESFDREGDAKRNRLYYSYLKKVRDRERPTTEEHMMFMQKKALDKLRQGR